MDVWVVEERSIDSGSSGSSNNNDGLGPSIVKVSHWGLNHLAVRVLELN